MKPTTALGLTLLFASHAMAHHAEAVFDHSQTLSVTGTVKEFLWANPHTLVYLSVSDATGKLNVATFEGGPAAVMTRNGWSRSTLKVGDTVAVEYYPRRDRKPGGLLVIATLADGKKLGWRPAGMP